jgi:hypothetical protein
METLSIFVRFNIKKKSMRYFETKFLDEADEFLAKLDPKQSEKSFTTLILLNKRMTQNFLRNSKRKFGNFGRNMQDFK